MTEEGFRREDLRLDPDLVRAWGAKASKRKKRHTKDRAKVYVLGGKIPVPWIRAAGALPRKTLLVGLALWFLTGCRRTRTVRLGGATLREFGINRWTSSRGLARLEKAGLVHVRRLPGRNPIVTLLLDSKQKRRKS
jgi:hypothetical protein